MKYIVGSELIDWREHSVVKFEQNSDVQVLVSKSYIVNRFIPYIQEWGIDSDAFMDDLIQRAYKIAIGSPVAVKRGLPQPVMGRIMLLRDMLIGFKLRINNKVSHIVGDDGKLVHMFY